MAKGNPLLGQLRGSVGDVVFSRFGGQQVSRARNRQPKNPQSIAQMIQRAKLGSAVAFFSRGQQALFKFAFESKKANESDYNAFMRYNINRVAPNTMEGVKDGNPVLGNFLMCQGTLTQIPLRWDESNQYPNIEHAGLPEGVTLDTLTVGQVSASLKAKYGLLDGDIITFVKIVNKNTLAYSASDAIFKGSYAPGTGSVDWTIEQFKLDSSSSKLMKTVSGMITKITSSTFEIHHDEFVYGPSSVAANYYQGIALVVSRVTTTGVKVSNSTLILNRASKTLFESLGDTEWLDHVAKSWKAMQTANITPDAILKGSLSVQ